MKDFKIFYKHSLIFQVSLFSLFIMITLRDKYFEKCFFTKMEIGIKILGGRMEVSTLVIF